MGSSEQLNGDVRFLCNHQAQFRRALASKRAPAEGVHSAAVRKHRLFSGGSQRIRSPGLHFRQNSQTPQALWAERCRALPTLARHWGRPTRLRMHPQVDGENSHRRQAGPTAAGSQRCHEREAGGECGRGSCFSTSRSVFKATPPPMRGDHPLSQPHGPAPG